MKKILSLIMIFTLVFTLAAASLTSCSDGKPVIGIMRFGSHASLTNCYDGVMQGLKENGINPDDYEIVLLDSNFDPTTANTHANQLVNRRASIIIAIATPSAAAAANAAQDSGIPVVFCAITDSSVMDNYKNITGSSDVPPFDKQLEVVTAFLGKGDVKIGVLYSTDESSSPFQVSELKKAAQLYPGMEILDSAVSDITTIDTKVNELIDRGVDCFVNLLDNTIVGKLESNILPITNEKNIPVFGSEIEQVKLGCAASASIDYVDVGKFAGAAAASILKGEKKADEIDVAVITDPTNYYNSKACEKLGLTVPSNIIMTDVNGK